MGTFYKCFLNLIFPPKCILCGKILSINTNINLCQDCNRKLFFVDSTHLNFYQTNEDYFDRVFCACKYTSILKKALHEFKFSNKPSYYRVFSKILYDQIINCVDYCKIDAIMSVPMRISREVERGYNQSQLIARGLSKLLGIPEYADALVKTRDTPTQSLLNREERQNNLKDAFKVIKPNKVNGKVVLLVDDILTTGITLNECSKVLKNEGVIKVFVAVIASGRMIG